MLRRCPFVPLGLLLPLVACSGEPGGSSSESAASSAVTQGVALAAAQEVATDSTETLRITSVVVTLSQIDARVADGEDDGREAWTTVSTKKTTLDLASPESATFERLGIAALPADSVDRLRLSFDMHGPNYVRAADGQGFALLPPTEIVVVVDRPQDAAPCTRMMALKLVGNEIVVAPGESAKWGLKPVVHATEVVLDGTCPSAADPNRGE